MIPKNLMFGYALVLVGITSIQAHSECTRWSEKPNQQQTVHVNTDDVYNGIPVSPECGVTACDNPTTINAYMSSHNNHLTGLKTLRYRVVNIANDDGSRPIVNPTQVQHQHNELVRAYLPYNITFELDHMIIRNTSLRNTGVLFGCDGSMIGDGICQPECVLYSTFNDGGDCDPKDAVCQENMVHDGVCDQVCNNIEHNFDGGDCCIKSPDNEPLCLDPASPNRRQYMTVEELKDMLRLSNDDRISIMFAEWTNSHLIGLATFPWDEDSRGFRGGIVLKPREYGEPGHTATLIHEMGHILGLWHVHHGVSEVDCMSPCYEWGPSMLTGDLCSDTSPTPLNMQCVQPSPLAGCGKLQSFVDAPYRNYMGYAGDACMDHFTDQQMARMHCYINSFLSDWRSDVDPKQFLSLFPLYNEGQVVLYWKQVCSGTSACPAAATTFEITRSILNRPEVMMKTLRQNERMFKDVEVKAGDVVSYTIKGFLTGAPSLVSERITVSVI